MGCRRCDAVVARARSQGLVLEVDQGMIDILNELGQFGPACRSIGMNCLGDNQDASYFLFTPKPLDVLTMLGFIVLVGTVVNNAILIVHQSLNHMREEGMGHREAIREGIGGETVCYVW